MSAHYVLDSEHRVRPAELLEWARFFEDFNNRRVARTTVGDVDVSTVFVGLDHRFHEPGDPLVFETMVFGGPLDQEMWRYSTWDEAVAGHEAACERVRES